MSGHVGDSFLIYFHAIGSSARIRAPGRRRPGPESLDRSIEAHDGLVAFRAVRSWHILAKRPEETYEEYLLNDGRIKTLLIKRRKDGVQVFLHDGKEGYSFVDGRRRDDAGASGEAYYRANGEYYLRALPFKWKDSGVQATYDGETVFEAGRPSSSSCRRLPARASPRRTCGARSSIKRATCCSKRASSTTRSMQTWMNPPQTGVNEIRYRYSDCRPVGRLRLPFRMEYWSSGCRTGENLVQTYELDVAVDPKLFRPETHLTAKR